MFTGTSARRLKIKYPFLSPRSGHGVGWVEMILFSFKGHMLSPNAQNCFFIISIVLVGKQYPKPLSETLTQTLTRNANPKPLPKTLTRIPNPEP